MFNLYLGQRTQEEYFRMNKHTKNILIVLVLLVVMAMPGTALDATPTAPVYITEGNVFTDFFREPVEILVFIAFNGKSYSLTNFDSSSVAIDYDGLKARLKEDGIEIKDLMCAVHNHVGTRRKFTVRDIRFYNALKADGFKGLFLLWSSPFQRITDWRYDPINLKGENNNE